MSGERYSGLANIVNTSYNLYYPTSPSFKLSLP